MNGKEGLIIEASDWNFVPECPAKLATTQPDAKISSPPMEWRFSLSPELLSSDAPEGADEMAESRKLSHEDYTIAWICALPLELAAAKTMLDETHPLLPLNLPASCTYSLGKISGHNVVLACLQSGVYGTTSAATLTSHLRSTFPTIQYGVLVGIGGGVRRPTADIRLGDVVVSKPTGESGGVIQYDFGKSIRDEKFQHTGALNQPPPILLMAVSQLQANHFREGTHRISDSVERTLRNNQSMASEFSRPTSEDRLFQPMYDHRENENTCRACNPEQEVTRTPRPSNEPHIHYGIIASGNRVIKDGRTRDQIAQEHDCLCFEMEAAGIMNELPCLVVRGICDYCDSHKNKDWQGYAALTAAAYAKILLEAVPINQPGRRQATPKVGWVVPFQKNPGFLGRSQQVARLEEMILGNTGVQKAALSGLGGVGKTQIAIELAYRIRKRDPRRSVFWIPSFSVEAIEQAFLNISASIGLQHVAPAEVKKEVKKYLSSDKAGSWFLIIDNADDSAMWINPAHPSTALKSFLPRGEHGFVLFTTRNQRLATQLVGSQVIRIQELDDATTTSLLRESLIRRELVDDEKSVAELLKQVHGLPLAITQAASYINENVISLTQYILLLNQQEDGLVELLSQHFEEDRRYEELSNAVALTWLVSFDQIRRLNSLAADYLSFISCIDNRDIPQSLLPRSDHISNVEHTNAIGLLKSYSFITEQSNNQFMSIHRLVHLAMRNWLRNEGKLMDWMTRASEILEDEFPSDDPVNRALWREYLPHAQFLLQSTESLGKHNSTELCKLVGRCLYSDGRYDEAEKRLREVMEARYRLLGPDDEETLDSINFLGLILASQGKYEEAEAMHQQILATRQKVLGMDHPETLASMNNLGTVLSDQGRHEEAEVMHKQALVARQMVLGMDHLETVISRNNLGTVLSDRGRYEEAEAMHQQALATRQKVLGMDHPETLESMNNLSTVLSAQGRYKEAEAMHQQILVTHQKVLGMDHPQTLGSMNNLGTVLSAQGRYKEAEAMHQQVLATRQKVLGMDHPQTLESMNNLGTVLSDQGRYEEAEAMHQQVLATRQKVLGMDHPETLGSMNNLGTVLSDQGRYKEAEAMHQQVLATCQKVLGMDHPQTLESMNNLGTVLSDQGRYKETEAMHQQILVTHQKVLGMDHPQTLGSMNNLGTVLSAQGRYEEAKAMHQQVLATRQKVLGMDHPQTLESMNNLGTVLFDQERYEEAEAMHQQVLATRQKVLGVDHPDTLMSMQNLSCALNELGQDTNAMELLQKCVRLLREKLGAEHPHTLEATAMLDECQSSEQDTSSASSELSIVDNRAQIVEGFTSSRPFKRRKRDVSPGFSREL